MKKKSVKFTQDYISSRGPKDIPKGKPYIELYDRSDSRLSIRVGKRSKSYYFTVGRKRYLLGSTSDLTLTQAQIQAKRYEEIDSLSDQEISKVNLRNYITDYYSRDAKISSKIKMSYSLFDMPIIKISDFDIEDWRDERIDSHKTKAKVVKGEKIITVLDEHISVSTVKREFNIIRAALNHARKRKSILNNPASMIEIKGDDSVQRRPIPDNYFKEYIQAVLHLEDEQFQLFMFLMIHTGARTSEVTNIKLENIDLDAYVINVPSAFSKTKKTRYLHLNPQMHTILKGYLHKYNYNVKYSNPEGWLFYNKSTKKPYKDFRKKYLKMVDENLLKYYSIYYFRHTLASYLANDPNVDIYWVKEVLGHASLSTTEIYTKPLKKGISKAMASYGDFITYLSDEF